MLAQQRATHLAPGSTSEVGGRKKLASLFGAGKQAKKNDAELGQGVWRRTHDRFRRGLDRFHQMLEGVRDDLPDAYVELLPIADSLADLLPDVREIMAAAQSAAPSDQPTIPAGAGAHLNDLNRELSRAGNALAAAAEAVALVRLGAGEVSGVVQKAQVVHRHVVRAQEILAAN